VAAGVATLPGAWPFNGITEPSHAVVTIATAMIALENFRLICTSW
jgi:hypothetical protein